LARILVVFIDYYNAPIFILALYKSVDNDDDDDYMMMTSSFKSSKPSCSWLRWYITGSAAALHCCKAHSKINRKMESSTAAIWKKSKNGHI